ncbi:hypothetical protein J6590_056459 [Homalodisca vitripennis]|nr:hypothetical protein J6590_056459 [Homalodisca vitripennis]
MFGYKIQRKVKTIPNSKQRGGDVITPPNPEYGNVSEGLRRQTDILANRPDLAISGCKRSELLRWRGYAFPQLDLSLLRGVCDQRDDQVEQHSWHTRPHWQSSLAPCPLCQLPARLLAPAPVIHIPRPLQLSCCRQADSSRPIRSFLRILTTNRFIPFAYRLSGSRQSVNIVLGPIEKRL